MARLLIFVGLLMVLAPAFGAPKVKSAKRPAELAAYRFVAYGDTRSNPDVHKRIVARIISLRPEFVLQTGDLVADGRNSSQWVEFDAIKQPLKSAGIAYYPARGNHDAGRYYIKQVTEPYDSGNGYYYAFTRNHNRFITVDNFEDFDPHSAQYHWLEAELARARTSAVNTFVMFHEGPFSVGPHGPTPDSVNYLHPLFVKYRPRIVFCGHDHLYYRTMRDGVQYVVSGGGGAELYAPINSGLAIPGDVYVKEHHVVLCEVDGPRVTVTAITDSGKVIDKFTVGPK